MQRKKPVVEPEKLEKGFTSLITYLKYKLLVQKAYSRNQASKHRPGRKVYEAAKVRAKRKLERQNKKKGRQ